MNFCLRHISCIQKLNYSGDFILRPPFELTSHVSWLHVWLTLIAPYWSDVLSFVPEWLSCHVWSSTCVDWYIMPCTWWTYLPCSVDWPHLFCLISDVSLYYAWFITCGCTDMFHASYLSDISSFPVCGISCPSFLTELYFTESKCNPVLSLR